MFQVRAKNDELEREKISKEKQVADEKKQKRWKEFHDYLQVLRQSIFPTGTLVQLLPAALEYPKEEILTKCLELKRQGFASQLEDWQWLCLVQVIVSTIIYVWKEPLSLVGFHFCSFKFNSFLLTII